MNKFLYFTFVNLPVKAVILFCALMIFLISLPEDKTPQIASKSIGCLNAPVKTDKKDSKGNNIYTCDANQKDSK